MLNDLKNWALEKGEETKELAHGATNEMQTTGVMDWSGTVWLVISGVVLIVIITAIRAANER